mmetsp:Transcript_20210/g.77568  ORF Transcript_20210/g.77568 Transcript_20210/m.77568 type:complete len:209 (-) Transcript_20210:1311-1937(-)
MRMASALSQSPTASAASPRRGASSGSAMRFRRRRGVSGTEGTAAPWRGVSTKWNSSLRSWTASGTRTDRAASLASTSSGSAGAAAAAAWAPLSASGRSTASTPAAEAGPPAGAAGRALPSRMSAEPALSRASRTPQPATGAAGSTDPAEPGDARWARLGGRPSARRVAFLESASACSASRASLPSRRPRVRPRRAGTLAATRAAPTAL